MSRIGRLQLVLATGLLFACSAAVLGQEVRRGEIAGSIKDDTGAALPGVTVTVSGSALQVPQIVRVSDERGEYHVLDLPAGTYRAQYELAGFGTLVREGIVLSTGFSARVDAVLKVATLAETITVSGQSPVVDVTTTRGGTTLSKDLIASVPGNQNFRDVLLMVGGIRPPNAPQTAAVSAPAGGGGSSKSYGAGVGTVLIEGVKIGLTEVSNMTAYEEADVKTFGNSADVDQNGTAIQLVIKSGGNEFHGRYNEIAQHKRFQSNNIDDALRAQGVTTGDTVVWYNDFGGDLGGRIIRDKLWFYGNVRDFRNKFTATGFMQAPGPDRAYGTPDDVLAFPKARFLGTAFKVSYQATVKNKFISVRSANDNHNPLYYDRYHPVESTNQQTMLMHETKPIEWQGTLTNRWLVDAYYGFGGSDVYRDWMPQNGDPSTPWVTGSGVPARLDRNTQQASGPAFNDSTLRHNRPWRHQFNGSVNYLPAGSFLGTHSIQAGYRLWLGSYAYDNPSGGGDNAGIGEYQLIFDTVSGLPHQPVEILAKTLPVNANSRENVHATYIMDSWRPTTRLTLNLGLRWERQNHWVDEGTKAQSYLAPFGTAVPIGTSGTIPRLDVNAWNKFAPRAGVAYDLSGNGKTVIKGTYGWFNSDLLQEGYALAFSGNSLVTYDYRWHDLNNDGNFQPGEVNVDVNGPDFVSVAGGTSNKVNPDLKLTHTHEVSASLERELGQGLSVRGLYVYKKVIDAFRAVNILRPSSVYDQKFTRQDPGPDGLLSTADDGSLYTIYDYNPAYRGAAFVSNVNINADPDRHDSYQNMEVMLTKRATGKWFANTSFLATKNHQWRVNVVTNPNDNIFPLDDYWDLTYQLAGGYTLPYDIVVSTLYQAYNGIARQRVVVFRAVDPAGGPRFPSSSTLTLPMADRGELRGPVRNIVNLRVGKDFKFAAGRKITASVDAFNAFNTNVAWFFGSQGNDGPLGITETSGPTYNQIYGIVQPRMLRFNVGFQF